MKAAFTIWNDRVSPVFDVAGHALLLEATQKEIPHQKILALPMDSPIAKLIFLSDEKVDLLVCGAISRSLQCAIEARGIKVYPFCSGEICELIKAWQEERLERVCFAMPGCGKGRRRNVCRNGCRCLDLHCGRLNQRN